mmetsp:Transcript_20218/g.80717  ORF Transcript_20218/g.80717 Transcript_20218/m.80717 type:complete len:212 (+) Transcript_20218:1168-1803(+)
MRVCPPRRRSARGERAYPHRTPTVNSVGRSQRVYGDDIVLLCISSFCTRTWTTASSSPVSVDGGFDRAPRAEAGGRLVGELRAALGVATTQVQEAEGDRVGRAGAQRELGRELEAVHRGRSRERDVGLAVAEVLPRVVAHAVQPHALRLVHRQRVRESQRQVDAARDAVPRRLVLDDVGDDELAALGQPARLEERHPRRPLVLGAEPQEPH